MSYLAQVSYTGDGSTTQYSITFPFIDSTHVKAFINGVETTAFTISSSTMNSNNVFEFQKQNVQSCWAGMAPKNCFQQVV